MKIHLERLRTSTVLLLAAVLFVLPLIGCGSSDDKKTDQVTEELEASPAADAALVISMPPLSDVLARVKGSASTIAPAFPTAAMVTGTIDQMTGPNGQLKGIDLNRPLGAYALLDEKDMVFVVAIPVTSEQEFVDQLTTAGVQATKGDDGIYAVTFPLAPAVKMRVDDGYASLATGKTLETTGPNPRDPAKVLKNPDRLLTITVRPSKIAQQHRDELLGLLKSSMPQQEKMPFESEADYKMRMVSTQLADQNIKMFVNETEEITAIVDLDKQGKITIESTVRPLAGTSLAESLATAKTAQNPLPAIDLPGEIVGRYSAFGVMSAYTEGIFTAIAVNAESDEEKQVFALVKKHLPENFAIYADLRQSADGPNLIAMATVKDGKGLEQVLREHMQEPIEVDVARAGDVAIHRVVPPDSPFEDGIYFAIGDKVLVAAAGKSYQELIERALTGSPGASNSPGEMELSGIRLYKLINGGKLSDEDSKYVQRIFGNEIDRLVVTSTLGDSYTTKFEYDLRAFSLLGMPSSLQTVFTEVGTELKPATPREP